ncbi:MAG: HEPN domain-containing protein [Isosphaeraceae bacterium]
MKKQTARWPREAEADLLGARSLARAKLPLHDLTCFHCQQSTEKYLRAVFGSIAHRRVRCADRRPEQLVRTADPTIFNECASRLQTALRD